MRDICHNDVQLHYIEDGSTDVDELRWRKIDKLRRSLAQDSARKKSLLTKLEIAFENKEYEEASMMQLEAAEKIAELEAMYSEYKRNLF